uniref:Synaptobrevin, longin-like domain protein n=1 Tax=Tanacetum cinerariifolium TaxID=118510 RepID=A0A6L2MTM7_TANCI|nr:hypothetical protein [Tanacetum cinerariifolium]
MEAIGIMWCADHNIYIYPTDFVSREEVPAHKIHSKPDAECYGKSASTPIDIEKPLLKDPNGQTATGKEISNPFMAGSLPKTMLLTFIHAYFTAVSSKVSVVWTDELFWTSVAVKKMNDVISLQALVDKKKVVIMEASIRDALRLDDAEGVECLPNKEIFIELARMGYEKPSIKITFYKAFFSSQWKFLIHTILQCDLSLHSTKYTSPVVTKKVFTNLRRVGKGFSRVDTSLFEGATSNDVNAAVEEPSIPSTTPPTLPPQLSLDIPSTSQVKKLERRNKLKVLKLRRLKRVGLAQRIDTSDDIVMDDVSKQGGIIANIDADEDVVLEDAKDVTVEKSADVEDNADIQGRKAEYQAKIYKIDLEHAKKIINEVVNATSDTITTASTTIIDADVLIPAATIAAAPTLTAAPSRRRKGVVIRDPQETTKEQIDEEDSRALKRLNESQEEKAAKKQKLDKEVEELKRHLQMVPNDEDDVYTEATPLARKVPVVNYEIYNENNKPYYKIKRADGSHQLYLSFFSLLWNFDREDLEALWS